MPAAAGPAFTPAPHSALRHPHAPLPQVGNTPGVTKAVQEVHLDKQVTLLDSPGVVFAHAGAQGTAVAALRNAVKAEQLEDPTLPVGGGLVVLWWWWWLGRCGAGDWVRMAAVGVEIVAVWLLCAFALGVCMAAGVWPAPMPAHTPPPHAAPWTPGRLRRLCGAAPPSS